MPLVAHHLRRRVSEEPPSEPEGTPIEDEEEQNEEKAWDKWHEKREKQKQDNEDPHDHRENKAGGDPLPGQEQGYRTQQPDHEEGENQQHECREELSLGTERCNRDEIEQGNTSASQPEHTQDRRSEGKANICEADANRLENAERTCVPGWLGCHR